MIWLKSYWKSEEKLLKVVRSERVENKETSGNFKVRGELRIFKNEKRSREELKINEIRKHRLD